MLILAIGIGILAIISILYIIMNATIANIPLIPRNEEIPQNCFLTSIDKEI